MYYPLKIILSTEVGLCEALYCASPALPIHSNHSPTLVTGDIAAQSRAGEGSVMPAFGSYSRCIHIVLTCIHSFYNRKSENSFLCLLSDPGEVKLWLGQGGRMGGLGLMVLLLIPLS